MNAFIIGGGRAGWPDAGTWQAEARSGSPGSDFENTTWMNSGYEGRTRLARDYQSWQHSITKLPNDNDYQLKNQALLVPK
jgi:hypothetical protein